MPFGGTLPGTRRTSHGYVRPSRTLSCWASGTMWPSPTCSPRPPRAVGSFAQPQWQRLEQLRAQRDPDGVPHLPWPPRWFIGAVRAHLVLTQKCYSDGGHAEIDRCKVNDSAVPGCGLACAVGPWHVAAAGQLPDTVEQTRLRRLLADRPVGPRPTMLSVGEGRNRCPAMPLASPGAGR